MSEPELNERIWTWPVGNKITYKIEYDESRISCGSGITKTVMHETATYGSDGTGDERARKGTRVFSIDIQRGGLLQETDINNIFKFLQYRKEGLKTGSPNESFYFYYPDEYLNEYSDPLPATEAEAINKPKGRYWVRCLNEFSLTLQNIRSRGFGTLTFTEDRS